MAVVRVTLFLSALCQTVLCIALQQNQPMGQENCVMSFVIPRDKVKSSCNIEEKVNRRLNLMESKLNLYHQEVRQLQTQLQKERQLCQNKLQVLEEKLSSFDPAERYDILAKKLHGLEIVLKKGGDSLEPIAKRENRYTGSWASNRAKAAHKKTSDQGDLKSIIKPIVISEIENYLENFTVIGENRLKVHEMSNNKIMDNWLRNDQSYVDALHNNKSNSKAVDMIKELEDIKNKLNETGNQVAVKVGHILKNVTIKAEILYPNANASTHETNFTDVENSNSTNNNETDSQMNTEQREITEKAQLPSRISITDGNIEPQMDQEHSENNLLVANLYTDELEEILRGEINMLLQSRMEEVISLMRKQSANLVTVVEKNSKEIEQMEEGHEEKMKQLHDKVDGMRLEIMSLSQTVQEFYIKMEKMPNMEGTMEEIKKNVSMFSRQRQQDIVIKVDEHEKKLRTLDRLYGIFQQSLQHYRNESKMAYHDMQQKLSNLETNLVRDVSLDLYINITSKLGREIERYNSTMMKKFQSMGASIRNLEDNSVLFQMDLKNLERRHKSKTGKLEEDYGTIRNRVDRLQNQHRKAQEYINHLRIDQRGLLTHLNTTSKKLGSLEIEFKLSVMNSWVEYNFEYDTTNTACFGKQYIRKTKYKNARLAGVVLCSNMRYKIMLANTVSEKFHNVGDVKGFGEDHCEFVGARSSSVIRLSTPAISMKTEEGFARENWGQEPQKKHLNFLRPSPAWYECGIHIP